MKINEHFLAQMREATALLQREGPEAATAAIQRALNGNPSPFSDLQPAAAVRPSHPQLQEGPDARPSPKPDDAQEHEPAKAAAQGPAWFNSVRSGTWAGSFARQAQEEIEDVEVSEADGQRNGRFLSGSCSNLAGTRSYKLYVPSGYTGAPVPLVVMLHGCTQDPDDFAAGTGMNAIAEEQNFLVVYPAQTKSANSSNCWNWFEPRNQTRDRGEPSLIADITRKVAREYKVDEQRIYVAGLSAGGAMAAILGARYPDLYAAIGVHSGLPVGVARDVTSAFAAMKRGKGKASPRAAAVHPPTVLQHAVPVIVFHGDGDRTVHVSNAGLVMQQCIAAAGENGAAPATEQGRTANGRRYTRAMHSTAQGRVIAENWTLHGAGHAWAGGNRKGSHTDATGPDASREMVRFFLSHVRQT